MKYSKEELEAVTPPVVNLPSLRRYIISKCPFFTSALQTITIEMVEDIDKAVKAPSLAWTNGTRIYLCPRQYAAYGNTCTSRGKPWFENADIGYAFIILHELGHIVFNSFGRLGRRDPSLWNTATDYQINQFVAKMMKETSMCSSEAYSKLLNVVMKGFLLDPAKYESMSAEMTYDDLYRIGMGKGNGGSGDGSGGGDPLAGDMVEDDEDSLSDDEKMTRDVIKSEMEGYVSKNAGKLPGSGTFGREFQFMLEPPKVKLRHILRNIPKSETREDWGFSSRGGRLAHFYSPKVRAPDLVQTDPTKLRKAVFVVDFSGSISNESMNKAVNIAKELIEKHVKLPVHLIIHTDEVVFSSDIKTYKDVPTGISGGTAFKPVLEELERLKKEDNLKAEVILWMTDYCAEMDPTVYDFKRCVNNPNKMVKWLLCQADSSTKPSCGSTFVIDEID